MKKGIDPRHEPVKWGLYFGVVFGLTYGIGWTILHYIRYREFTWFSLALAAIAMLVSVGLGFLIRWRQNRGGAGRFPKNVVVIAVNHK